MGIANLLPFVKNACRQGSINEFRNLSIAIDVSCLLHRGLFGCMEQFANGYDSKTYIDYVMKRVQVLLHMGCHVILVFDGSPLPAKKDTNDQRRQRRAENMRVGSLLLSQGKKDEAVTKFQQAVSITREVVETTIEHFRSIKHVDVIVAPYEADAQLAFLLSERLADAIITEDSDLIVFGCDKIIFKWSVDSGVCTVYNKDDLPSCFTGEMSKNFDFQKFRRICILSGCDYLQEGLPGVGLSKAYAFFSKTNQTNLNKVLPRIPSYLKMPKLNVSQQFIESFIKAERTFLHQIVFDPISRCQRPLMFKNCSSNTNNEIQTISEQDIYSEDDLSYAGQLMSPRNSIRAALGNLIENQSLHDKFLLLDPTPEWSIWSKDNFNRAQKAKEKNESIHKSLGVLKVSPTINIIKKDVEVNSKRKIKNGVEEIWSWEAMLALNSDSKTESKITDADFTVSERNQTVNDKDLPQNKNIIDSTLPEKSGLTSSYFKRRNSSCSNPFKKPKLTFDAHIDEEKRICSLEKKEESKESFKSISTPIQHCTVGFRPSGLRKSRSN